MFSRQGQLFTGGPAEGFLQKMNPAARLAALVVLVGAAALCHNAVALAVIIVATLLAAILAFLDVPSILRVTALPVAVLALPSWAAAVFFFDATAAAAVTGILRVGCCVLVSVTLLHSIGLTQIAGVMRRLGLPEELCLAWRMMIAQSASFAELSGDMQLAREARAVGRTPGWLARRQTGSQAGILLARMVQRGQELAMANDARNIAPPNILSGGAQINNGVAGDTPGSDADSGQANAGQIKGAGPLFSLRHVSHCFSGEEAALDAISAEILPGGCTALLGANGAGKSTLLHLLAGLLTATAGEVLWQGERISAELLKRNQQLRGRFRRSVGIVFQDPDCQWLCNTVQEEVELGPRQIWPAEEARERAAQVMVLLGVNHLADRPPYMLSGGQKRRVALASVLAMDPDVLLLDEPTLSLDAATTDFLMEWLTEFLADKSKTLILATHDLGLVRELAHSAVVITPCHRLGRAGGAADILADIEFLQQMNLASRRRGLFSVD